MLRLILLFLPLVGWVCARPIFVSAENAMQPSHTIVHSTPLQFKSAKIENLRAVDFAVGLFSLAGNSRQGWVESAPLGALYPFHELVASGDADLPPGSGFSMEAQVRFLNGTWSRWYAMGRFGLEGASSQPGQEDEKAKVDVDTLKLKEPAGAFRYRVTLMGKERGKKPVLRLVAVTYTNRSFPVPLKPRFSGSRPGMDLKVPERSQMTEQAEYAKDICSPASLGMVLAYWRKPASTMEAARGCYDQAEKIYGNWFFNTAYAGARGMEAYVLRFNSMEELEAEVRSGHPTIVSIAFNSGELRGAPIVKTKGHLLVVRGWDTDGDVIVNDPADPRPSQVRKIYRRNEFAKAWLGRKFGLAYRLEPPWPKEMVVGVPVTDLRNVPGGPRPPDATRNPLQESQLLLGERVRVVQVKKGWAQVQVLEQERWEEGEGWQFYPGWVRLRDLAPAGQWPGPNEVVRDKTVQVRVDTAEGGEESLELSVGTRLYVMDEQGGQARVFLPGSRAGFVSSRSLLPLKKASGSSRRKRILETARLFLGDGYFWGGRSASGSSPAEDPLVYPGPRPTVDCSGLVSLSYRVAGVEVPRNAHDQYLWCRRLQRSQLEKGDLIFLSKKDVPEKITHVMIYSGHGRIIEASGDVNRVREIPVEEKLGLSLKKLESGSVLDGRAVYFGRCLE